MISQSDALMDWPPSLCKLAQFNVHVMFRKWCRQNMHKSWNRSLLRCNPHAVGGGGRGGWGLNIWRGKSFMGHFSSTGFTQCKNLSSHLPEDEKRRKMILNSNFKSRVCVGWCRYYVGGIRRLAALHMSPIIMDLSGRPQQKVYNYPPPRPRPMHSSFSGSDNAKNTLYIVSEDVKRKVLFSFRHCPN